MKIEVRTPGLSFPIKIVFPTGLMKSKLIWKSVEKNSGWEDQDTFRQYQPMLAACCDELTDYVKKNGHFNLVEVEQPEGTKVIIRV